MQNYAVIPALVFRSAVLSPDTVLGTLLPNTFLCVETESCTRVIGIVIPVVFIINYNGVVQPTLGYHIANRQSRYITPARLKSAYTTQQILASS